MGNIFYQQVDQINPSGFGEWQIIYENKFKAPAGLYKDLRSIVEDSEYYEKTGNHYEERVGMLNFSIVGRNAECEQRLTYSDYDLEYQERAKIVEGLKEKYPSLDFVIGGAVSIDIFKTGHDKSQVIERYFDEAIEHNKIVFVGDRIPFPGNDYALAVALQQHTNGTAIEVKTWEDTSKLLKTEPFA
jgi:phosphomannomutase